MPAQKIVPPELRLVPVKEPKPPPCFTMNENTVAPLLPGTPITFSPPPLLSA
mgnify:CR=1 FL=1